MHIEYVLKPENLRYIYWFASYSLDSPSVRYRAQYPLEYFRERYGIESVLIMPSYKLQAVCQFLKAYFSALLFRKKNSLIVVQRVRSSFIYATLLKLLVKVRRNKTVYDLDDADYLQYSPGTILFFLRNSDCISAGSHAISLYSKKFNDNVWLTPSPTPDLHIVKKERNPVFTIGWIGGFSWGHKDSMVSTFFPALKDLPFPARFIILGVQKEDDLTFIHNYFAHTDSLQITIPRHLDWRDEKDMQKRIAVFDVGIATLSDTRIHRGKSGIKVKQYLNNGVPVLTSDLPENNHYVRNGVNGYICRTSEDFRRGLIELHQMSDETYRIMTENARNSRRDFDLDAYCDIFVEIFNRDCALYG